MNLTSIELSLAYRLLNHGVVTLVTSHHAGCSNVMAASWVMPLDFDPPKVLAVIDKSSLTRELVDQSGEFALNIPVRAQADQVLAVGSVSGRERDKFVAYGLKTFRGGKVAAPLIAGCAAWLECRVIAEPENERNYDLFIGEVVGAWADPEIFSGGRWHFPDEARRTLHYQSGGAFFATGEAFNASVQPTSTRG